MESEKAKSLAHAVRALIDLEADFSLVKKEYNQRIETIKMAIHKLSNDILTGQGELPLDEIAEVQKAQADLQKLAERDGTKCTLEVEGRPPIVIADGTVTPKPKRHRPDPPPSEAAPF